MKQALFFVLAISFSTVGNAQTTGDITVTIQEIKDIGKGEITLMLFSSNDGFPIEKEKALFKSSIKEFDSEVEYTFKDVPFGTYALAAYQDKNENGKVDRKRIIPMPKEPIGVLNMTRMSRPKFDNSTFELNAPELSLTLTFVNQ